MYLVVGFESLAGRAMVGNFLQNEPNDRSPPGGTPISIEMSTMVDIFSWAPRRKASGRWSSEYQIAMRTVRREVGKPMLWQLPSNNVLQG